MLSRRPAAGQRPRGLTTLFALPDAVALVDPRLAQPPGIDAVPALGRRWRVHHAQAVELLGEAVLDTLAAHLRRLGSPRRPATASAVLRTSPPPIRCAALDRREGSGN